MAEGSEAKWYILHTYSGYENKVMTNILTLVENRGLQHLIEEVMVPTEMTTEVHDGKTKQVEVKLYPCYVYVKMVITDESWYICRNTRGVTGFVGPGSKPIALTDEEIANLGVANQNTIEQSLKEGEHIKVVSGPLAGYDGVIKEFDEANAKALITVSMFGRDTPATLDISAIKKL